MSITRNVKQLRRDAERYLSDEEPTSRDSEEVLQLAKKLRTVSDFGLARSVLHKRFSVGVPPKDQRIYSQQIALTTYKDPELRSVEALKHALELATGGSVAPPESGDADDFGIPGAIYKRLFAVTGESRYLYRSLRWYEAGWTRLRDHYPGVNAAFVHDLLANDLDAHDPRVSDHIKAAQGLREKILGTLDPLPEGDQWAAKSKVECLVALGRSDEAAGILREDYTPETWEDETFVCQLALIVGFRQMLDPPDEAALKFFGALVGIPTTTEEERRRVAVRAGATADRFGVALSGGGFRASFFHLGVLAAMAEHDVLRHIEILSCVSGGAIVGAHYTLALRRLIGEKPDEITQDDYCTLVRDCIDTFVSTVTSTNMRSRALSPAGWLHRLKPGNNLSTRLGKLYDQLLFSKVDPNGSTPRTVERLAIFPSGEIEFNPKRDNWLRSARVPITILNATSLNTCYGWQFAATWMGEPAIPADRRIDSLDYSQRIYYEYLPEDRVPKLGEAVAASACVPGLFPPVVLKNLVENRTVRLVDGGVNDNQGTSGLLDHDCTALFLSDASGQLSHSDQPSGLRILSALRSSKLSRWALRSRGYAEVQGFSERRIVLWFVHLTNGLRPGRRRFIHGPDFEYYVPGEGDENSWKRNPKQETEFDIPREMQELLAGIRTDLDRFSNDEAGALMYSGYQQTLRALHLRPQVSFIAVRTPSDEWPFLRLAKVIESRNEEPEPYRRLLAQLRKGRHRFFRSLRR